MDSRASSTETLDPDSLTDEELAAMAYNPTLARRISDHFLALDTLPGQDNVPELLPSTGEEESKGRAGIPPTP